MKTITKPITQTPAIGGKANNLLLLEQLELNVPQWVVIPSYILDNSINSNLNKEDWCEAIDKLKIPATTFGELEIYFGSNYKNLNYAVLSLIHI